MDAARIALEWLDALQRGDTSRLCATSCADLAVIGIRAGFRGPRLVAAIVARHAAQMKVQHVYARGSAVVVILEAHWPPVDGATRPDAVSFQLLGDKVRLVERCDQSAALFECGLSPADLQPRPVPRER